MKWIDLNAIYENKTSLFWKLFLEKVFKFMTGLKNQTILEKQEQSTMYM